MSNHDEKSTKVSIALRASAPCSKLNLIKKETNRVDGQINQIISSHVERRSFGAQKRLVYLMNRLTYLNTLVYYYKNQIKNLSSVN